MEPVVFEPLTPHVVLGIAAHPDDLDVGAAGTMAHFAKQGANVHYVIITDGSKGSEDRRMSSEKLVSLRESEQQAALKLLGGQSVSFLHYPDGGLEITQELKKQLVEKIRTIKPDVVVTMDPSVIYAADFGFINHPDHRAAGQATLDAVFPLARDHLSFPELDVAGIAPHKTPTVLLINLEKRNFTVDISDSFDLKIAALRAHASQFSDLTLLEQRMRQMAARVGATAGSQYAEGFIRLDVRAG